MQDHILLTSQGRNRVVDVCGLVCLTGYAALAWYSRATTWAPVDTRVRIGKSKISGTLRGAVGASTGILCMIAKLRWQQYCQYRYR